MKKVLLILVAALSANAAEQTITIRFQAQVGEKPFACGQSYEGVGTTKSKISGRDFRFYVSNVRLTDASGKETPVNLTQDGKWQLDDLALLDFENGTGGCANGNPDLNSEIKGSAPVGTYQGLRFTLGVPFNKNHTDPLKEPSPLNLTALFWVWNAGHKFARLDFSSTGIPRGFVVHLGSTGCTPGDTELTIPTTCKSPNRVEVEFSSFDPSRDVVVADLAALLQDTNVDESQNRKAGMANMMGKQDGMGQQNGAAMASMPGKPGEMAGGMMMGAGCMSGPTTGDCAGLFKNFGLAFGDKPATGQNFFRVASTSATRASR